MEENFSTNIKDSGTKSNIIFICVGTPTKKNGYAADLSQVYSVTKEIKNFITSRFGLGALVNSIYSFPSSSNFERTLTASLFSVIPLWSTPHISI